MSVLRVLLPLAGLFAGLLLHADLDELGRHLARVGVAWFGAVLAVHALSFFCDVLLRQLGFPPAPATRGQRWTWYRVRGASASITPRAAQPS
ncbi:MAG: hypothetical protein AB7I32_02245 [Gammaproteobacteria bacterium]